MKLAKATDKEKVLRILCESFDKNPRVNFILKQDHRKSQRLRALAEYAFEIGLRRNGIFLTDDNLGLAILFPSQRWKLSLYEHWLQIKMALRCFSIERLPLVHKVENVFQANRTKQENYLYFWFFGVANEALGSGDARELIHYAFDLSAKTNLPIYLETSLERNTRIYARYGFQIYNKVNVQNSNLCLWYMKRPCSVHESKKTTQALEI